MTVEKIKEDLLGNLPEDAYTLWYEDGPLGEYDVKQKGVSVPDIVLDVGGQLTVWEVKSKKQRDEATKQLRSFITWRGGGVKLGDRLDERRFLYPPNKIVRAWSDTSRKGVELYQHWSIGGFFWPHDRAWRQRGRREQPQTIRLPQPGPSPQPVPVWVYP